MLTKYGLASAGMNMRDTIFYRPTGEGVLIVAIIHRRMRPDLDPDV